MNTSAAARGLALLAALALMFVNADACAATVRLGSAPGFPGRPTAVPLELRANTNLPPNVVALQADILFDPAAASSQAPNPGGALRGHRLASREPAPGVRRVVVYSAHNTPMTNGTVVRLPFDVLPANYQNVRLELTNVVLATASDGQLASTNFPGVIFLRPVFFAEDGTAEGFLSAPVNERYLIQATTNLVHWVNIATNEAVGSIIRFLDADAARFPQRFYRAVIFGAAGQLGTITQLSGGRMEFSFTGLAGRPYTLEASTNLVNWQAVGTAVAGPGTLVITNAAQAFPYRFFRLKSDP